MNDSLKTLLIIAFLIVILYARGLRLPTDAKAWKLFGQQQTINSTIPFLMITWAQLYVSASSTVVLASDLGHDYVSLNADYRS